MTQNKTVQNTHSVAAYIAAIANDQRRADFAAILELIGQQTGYEPTMWGTAIVGFGSYHYQYESGREGDMPLVALAARANTITFYLGANFEQREELLAKFGKYKTGKGCIHIKQLADIDINVLLSMIKNSVIHRQTHKD